MNQKLPIESGPHKVDIENFLNELFELDTEIFNIPPISFPFKTPEELLKYLTQEHKTTTIIWNNNEGELVGYLSYEEHVEIPNTTELINLGVKPEFQGKGYGKKMLEYYLDLFPEMNSRLVTHPENTVSRSLYEKMGYIPVKITENYFGDGQPRLLYFRYSSK